MLSVEHTTFAFVWFGRGGDRIACLTSNKWVSSEGKAWFNPLLWIQECFQIFLCEWSKLFDFHSWGSSAFPDRVRGSFTPGEMCKPLWALPVGGCGECCNGGGSEAVGEQQSMGTDRCCAWITRPKLALVLYSNKPQCQIFLTTNALDWAAKHGVLTAADRDNVKCFAFPLVVDWY